MESITCGNPAWSDTQRVHFKSRLQACVIRILIRLGGVWLILANDTVSCYNLQYDFSSDIRWCWICGDVDTVVGCVPISSADYFIDWHAAKCTHSIYIIFLLPTITHPRSLTHIDPCQYSNSTDAVSDNGNKLLIRVYERDNQEEI